MDNTELTRSWNEHFPKWRNNMESAHICGLLCELFQERARLVTIRDTDVERLHHVLETYQIPFTQFVEVMALVKALDSL